MLSMRYLKTYGSGLFLALMVSCAHFMVPDDATATPRVIRFAGYDWTVRESKRPTAPGGNTFSAAATDVWVDESGRLHLTLSDDATEVRSRRGFGYGVYEARLLARFVVEGSVVPDSERERLYFNFWRYQGKPLQHADREEIIVADFRFRSVSGVQR